MKDRFKEFVKQVLPYGLCDYSVRRHDFMRQGFTATEATRIALSRLKYQALCDSRLNLLPKEITSSLHTCVDAGAHVGSWTEALLDLFSPGRIIALECEPRLVEGLKRKFRDRPHVTVIDAALSADAGTMTFYQLQHPASSSLLRPRAEIEREYQHDSWKVIGEVPVRTVSYDEVVAGEQEVSILKLDIQGAEMDVLKNSTTGLDKTKSVIMEVNFTPHYDRDASFPDLHQLMAGRGFGLYRLSSVYHRGGRALFADAVYVKENILQALVPQP
jgi:FkbM family methyltransferase